MSNKAILRKKLNLKRSQLSTAQVEIISQQICNKIATSETFVNSHCTAIYSAFKNEVDITVLLKSGKRLCLPIVKKDNAMDFHQCNKNTEFSTNKYGILEPKNNLIVSAEKIDLCLLPLLGFNRLGHRLGMGGGYYDRYFENNKSQKNPTILAGIAYDFQEDDTIQAESWDVPLDVIFTNKEVIFCGEKS